MKLLAFLETINLREGFMDAAIETAVPAAIERLHSEMMSGNDSGVAVELFRLHEYGDPHDDPEDYDDPETVEWKYKRWLDEWCEARVEHAAYDIVNGMSHNRQAHMDGIVIYRVIRADENFPSNIKARGLGEYWSWEEGAAEAHWAGDGEITYLIVGLVDPKHVDWEHSLMQNAHPSFDHEKELYIPEGSPIELYKLLLGNGDEVDPQKYGGRQMLQASIGEGIYDDVEPMQPIKLSGFGPDSGDVNRVQAFMSDYKAATKSNPLSDHARMYGNVRLSIAPMKGGIHLADINATGARTGDGLKALKFIISLADKHGIEVSGTAKAYSAPTHDKEQESDRLRSWYRRLGRGKVSDSGREGGYDLVYKPRGIAEENLAWCARFARLLELREPVDLDEGPSDFSDMNLDTDGIQDSLNYFHDDHAPKMAKKAEGEHKSLGKLDGYDLVVTTLPAGRWDGTDFGKGGQYLFLLDDGRPVIYVALENYRDGVAIGNVRSTGEYPASKFYHHILKNISDPLYSDRRQTTGGRKIWADLAKHYPDVNIADQGPGHRLRASFDNRSAHGDDITESAGGQFVYHAATARDFGSIMQKGLTFFNPSRWVKAGNPDERYQDGPSVFAFEHPVDAWRWAAKMEWEFKEPAVVIKFKRGDSWEQDPSDDISLQMGHGKALESKVTIPPSDIVGAKTVEQVGTPRSTGLQHEEFEKHVFDMLGSM